jgi:tetratricopeptide (TPR) repeat protein
MTASDDPLDRGTELHVEALEQARRGDYEAAVPLLIESLRLKSMALSAGDESFRTSMLNLGRAFLETGRHQEARRVLLEVLERAYVVRGPQGRILDVLGQLHHEMGEPDVAIAYYLRAVEFLMDELGREASAVLRTLSNAAHVALDYGGPFDDAAGLASACIEELKGVGEQRTIEGLQATLGVAMGVRSAPSYPERGQLSARDFLLIERYRAERDEDRLRWIVDVLADRPDAVMSATMAAIDAAATAGGLGERILHETGKWVVTSADGSVRHELFAFGPKAIAVTAFLQYPIFPEELDATQATSAAWSTFDFFQQRESPEFVSDTRIIAPRFPDIERPVLGATGLLRLGRTDVETDIVSAFEMWRPFATSLLIAAGEAIMEDQANDPELLYGPYLPTFLWI